MVNASNRNSIPTGRGCDLPIDETYPDTPSWETTEDIPLNVPLRVGGIVVCMRTLTDSNGHKATSAMSSAEALAVR